MQTTAFDKSYLVEEKSLKLIFHYLLTIKMSDDLYLESFLVVISRLSRVSVSNRENFRPSLNL